MLLPRALAVRALAAAATLSVLPCATRPASAIAPQIPSQTTVPLSLCGGAYCAGYTIDGQRFRAVIDTGSPFLLVDGTCGEPSQAGARTYWGCYRGEGKPTGLEDTTELFGGQDVGTEWRRGSFAFAAGTADPPSADDSWRPADSWLTADDATFGIVRDYVGKGGNGAVFLGLAKRRLDRIRPTLLEQTRVSSMSFDFLRRTLTLSSAPQIPQAARNAVRLVDLRPRGAPVAAYGVRVSKLIINGERVKLDRPAIAIIDTGTTGISISDSLLDSGLLPPSVRSARIEMRSEASSTVALESSVRKRRPPSAGIPSVDELGIDYSAAEFDEFPLIVSPVHVPWFDDGFGSEPEPGVIHRRKRSASASGAKGVLLARADGLGAKGPHVLFVGLSFLWQRRLTIDVDAGRLAIV